MAHPTADEDGHASYRKGLLITLAGAALLTVDAPLLRLVDGAEWTVMFWRGLMIFAALLAFWMWARLTGRISHGFINGWSGAVVGGCYSLAGICFILALHNTTIANLVFILALVPLLAAVLSFFILRERLAPATWIAIACSLVGVFIIVEDGMGRGTLRGDLLALAAAASLSLALVLTRRAGKNFSTAPGVAGLVAALFAIYFVDDFALNGPQIAWLSLNGLFAAPLAFGLLALAPRYVPATQVGLFHLMETALAPLWIWLLIGEMPSRAGLIGGSVIILTLALHGLHLLARERRLKPA